MAVFVALRRQESSTKSWRKRPFGSAYSWVRNMPGGIVAENRRQRQKSSALNEQKSSHTKGTKVHDGQTASFVYALCPLVVTSCWAAGYGLATRSARTNECALWPA